MAQPQLNNENTQSVKVGLIDGGERVGRIRAFSPKDTELTLEDEADCDALPSLQPIPTSSVAYVAFRNRGAPARGREHESETRLRVHLPHGRTILVEPITDPKDPLGFRAALLEAEDGIEEIFFYAHAISRIELDKSIGSSATKTTSISRKSWPCGSTSTISIAHMEPTAAKRRTKRYGRSYPNE